AIWILATLILSNSFAGVFYSFQTIPRFNRPVDTIPELLEYLYKSENYLITSKLYANHFAQSQSDNSLYHQLGKHYNATPEKLLFLTRNASSSMNSVSPHFAIIQTRLYFKVLIKNFGNLFHVGSEDLNQDIMA